LRVKWSIVCALSLSFGPPIHSGLGAVAYPTARFTDPDRVKKLEAAFPEIDKIFEEYAGVKRLPGLVWGLVIDDELRHVGVAGVRDEEAKAPMTEATVFRIASMTKSFTALAILKLRDEGKLSLEDPVTRWIPELSRSTLPTRDSAPIKIRNLLSQSGGFPEDNPWADQRLGISEANLTRWLGQGLPFSTAPDTRYEYSNSGFAVLGLIVTRVAGMPYQKYIRDQLLTKLGMTASTFQYSRLPRSERATGYRLVPQGGYQEEAPLPQGGFDSAGGLATTAHDLGRYIAFHLAAWPPRDALDDGPVRRSSVREMAHFWTPNTLTSHHADSVSQVTAASYGYGLRVFSDCRFERLVRHDGGLPGYGSSMQWLPEYGVGIFAMTNLTYGAPADAINRAWDALIRTGGLKRRELPPSRALEEMGGPIFSLWTRWDDEAARRISAANLFLDEPVEQRRRVIDKLKEEVGGCSNTPGATVAENWLRGQFNIRCAHGVVGAFFTLSPTEPPRVQYLTFRKLESEAQRLGAPTGAPAGVTCD
jgi:CubicO group peptidase (beta-lactamase class C family)